MLTSPDQTFHFVLFLIEEATVVASASNLVDHKLCKSSRDSSNQSSQGLGRDTLGSQSRILLSRRGQHHDSYRGKRSLRA